MALGSSRMEFGADKSFFLLSIEFYIRLVMVSRRRMQPVVGGLCRMCCLVLTEARLSTEQSCCRIQALAACLVPFGGGRIGSDGMVTPLIRVPAVQTFSSNTHYYFVVLLFAASKKKVRKGMCAACCSDEASLSIWLILEKAGSTRAELLPLCVVSCHVWLCVGVATFSVQMSKDIAELANSQG